jgi:hypothetical protein
MRRQLARLSRWFRYHRHLRALVIDAGTRREPLTRARRAELKDQARTAARLAGK